MRASQVSSTLGSKDPRTRSTIQLDGLTDDPEAFETDRFGRTTVRLAPEGGLERRPGGHAVRLGRFLRINRKTGLIELNTDALLGASMHIANDGRIALRLGNLRTLADGSVSTAPATNVADLVDSSGGTTDGTIEAVPSSSLAAIAAAANNNFAELWEQLAEIKQNLGAGGYGIGQEQT